MVAVMSPQHLHRLNLLSDQDLSNDKVDLFLLLKQALARIPEIPFSLAVDKYRWDVFNGNISVRNYNRVYWEMSRILRGLKPPENRGEEFFDIGSKFHISDNTPYIRYVTYCVLVYLFMFSTQSPQSNSHSN